MGAEVLGCGHAYHLFHEVDFMENSPQVHLHFLTSDEEFKRDGYGKVELVCHGCGESLLVYYGMGDLDLKIRNNFERAHFACPNRGFEQTCPNYRRHCGILDLRIKPQEKKAHRSGRDRVNDARE